MSSSGSHHDTSQWLKTTKSIWSPLLICRSVSPCHQDCCLNLSCSLCLSTWLFSWKHCFSADHFLVSFSFHYFHHWNFKDKLFSLWCKNGWVLLSWFVLFIIETRVCIWYDCSHAVLGFDVPKLIFKRFIVMSHSAWSHWSHSFFAITVYSRKFCFACVTWWFCITCTTAKALLSDLQV